MTNHKQNLMFNKNLKSETQYYSELVVWIVTIKLEMQNLRGVLLQPHNQV